MSDFNLSKIKMDNSRKVFWDEVIKGLIKVPHKKINGVFEKMPNSQLYVMYEHFFGDLTEGMTPKQVAKKINNEALKHD